MKKIKKAVLPVAGLGTRFLPATKSSPKEMLPVVDRPLIQYAIDEARAAGIEEFCLVTARGKDTLIDYFDQAFELQSHLEARNKLDSLCDLEDSAMIPGNLVAVRQQNPLGLGHAIWCARSFIGNDPFAVILPDDIVTGADSCIGQLIKVYEKTSANVVAVERVPPEKASAYGMVGIKKSSKPEQAVLEVESLIEKPALGKAPSDLGIIGRYIFGPEILEPLSRMQKSVGGEIQLTDAMLALLPGHRLLAVRYNGTRFDCGNKLGFLEAQIALALERTELAAGVRQFLQKYI